MRSAITSICWLASRAKTVSTMVSPIAPLGDFVSGSYFDVLGVEAILGRTFTAEDDVPGKTPVAIISYNYWGRRFARDTPVIGKTVTSGGIPFTIIGVTSQYFFGRRAAGRSADIVLPMFVHSELALKDHDSSRLWRV